MSGYNTVIFLLARHLQSQWNVVRCHAVTYPINSFPAAVNKVLMHGCYQWKIFLEGVISLVSQLLFLFFFFTAANLRTNPVYDFVAAVNLSLVYGRFINSWKWFSEEYRP